MLGRLVQKRSIFGTLLVLLAIIIACGGEAAPAPAPTMDPAVLDELRMSIEKLAESQPEGEGLTADQVKSIVNDAIGGIDAPEGLTGAQVQSIVGQAISAIETPEGLTAQQVEAIVGRAAPEGLSVEQVQAIVENALAAAETPEGLTAAEVERIVGDAMAMAATPAAMPAEGGRMFGHFPASRVDPRATQGGVLTTIAPSIRRFFDAHTTDDPNHTLWPLYSGLVNYDWTQPTITIVPDLAESWTASEDGLTWTFNLVQNATFHKGSALTAHDVVMSMNRHYQHPAYESAVAPFLENWLETDGLEATDDWTVVLRLKAIRPDMLAVFANNNFSVMPTELIEELGGPSGEAVIEDEAMIDGSGPFMFLQHDDEAFFEVERFPNYYRPDRTFLDGMKQLISADEAVRNAFIRTGQADLYWGTGNSPAQQLEAQQQMPRCEAGQKENCLNYGATSGTRLMWYMLNPAFEPFQDYRVRRAFFLSLDRWDVIDKIELGAGAPIIATPPDFGGATLAEIEQIPGMRRDKVDDFNMARMLLAEAGHSGLEVEYLQSGSLATRQSTEIFADGLRSGGFTVNANVPPDDAERQRRESLCDFNYIVSRIAPDYADPGAYLVMWEEGQPQNRCNIPFPKLWALWDQQATSLDPAFRASIVEQMEDILINDEEEGLWAMFTHTLGHPYTYSPQTHWDPPKILRGWGRFWDMWKDQ
jgi:peptide/nickel transport system substrate-binding protein